MNRFQRKNLRRGASSVEFALVFPLILTFFTGLIAFSQAILLRDTAQHAAYEGAREGLNLNSTGQDMRTAAQNFLQKLNVKSPIVEISPNVLSNSTEEVSVSIRIPFRDNAWIAAAFIPENWNMGAEVTLSRFKLSEDR